MKTTVAPQPISELRAALDGGVIEPGDDSYEEARTVFYGGIDRRPAAIVSPSNAAEVARAVSLARDSDLELAVRGGGHSIAGQSVVDGGIVIDTRAMRAIEIDATARVATAEAGLTAAEYSAAAGEHGLVTGFGDAGSVGIAGITLGGGVGFLSRAHGLTIDELLGATVVTADGSILEVDAGRHPDLFWAIRGGGGNFGVVTSLRYRLRELETVVGGMLIVPASPAAIHGFALAAAEAPDELSVIASVMPAPPLPFLPAEQHGRLVIFAQVCYAGPAEDGERALAPLRSIARPLVDMVRPIPFAEIYPPEEDGYHPTAIARTMFADTVGPGDAEAIFERIEAAGGAMCAVQIRVLGGAIARVGAAETAYAHRDSPLMINVAAFYAGEDERAERQAWVEGLAATLDQGREGAYVNFLGDEGPERVRAAYPGSTWERLREVKRRYDPANLFRGNQNIPPATG